MNRQQRGFTLIELVVVITLIGILAAVALPKFINIQKDARVSVMKGVAASMRGAAALVYSKALIAGVENSSSAVNISVNGKNISTKYGYPVLATMTSLLTLRPLSDFTINSSAGSVQYKTQSNCTVTYVPPTAVNAAPTIATSLTCG